MFSQKSKVIGKLVIGIRRFLLIAVFLQFLTACGLFYTKEQIALYHVQSGDTLGDIAQRFNTTAENLRDYNRLASADVIHRGQILEIPVSNVDPLSRLASRNVNTQYASRTAPRLISSPIRHQHKTYVLSWPTKNHHRLSSKFGRRWTSFHEGIDLAGKRGTPIYAAHSGKVVVSGYQLSGYGKMVIIQNKDLLTVYAHNNRNHVRRGEYVNAGQHIADIGSTGKSTGPHLHFEVRLRNHEGKFAAVNPLQYLPTSS